MKRLSFAIALVVLVTALSVSLAASTETILHSFTPDAHGVEPSCVISDGAGNLYVVARGGTHADGVIVKFTPNSQGLLNETVLYNFTGGSDGGGPIAILLDGNGNLFGLTIGGGANSSGTLFELTPAAHGAWQESVLFSFPNANNGYLSGGLAEDQAGNFYGTTDADDCCGSTNYGSIFQLTNSGGVWTQNVIHVFTNGADGGRPFGRLNLDQAGNVYGTASQGGTNNHGLVFEFVPAAGGVWTENVLYDFTGGSDGAEPDSEVIFDGAGNLYGTTQVGGSGGSGSGTAFELKKGSGGQWTEQTLYAFKNIGFDAGDLIFDSAGNLYGSLSEGGPCCGSVFELSPNSNGSWTETTLWTFHEQGDGGSPTDVLLGPQGQLYGGTFLGGSSVTAGSIFELQSKAGKWELTTLYGFPLSDGSYPYAGLTFDGAGNLYGTTDIGGLQNLGSVFKLAPAGQGWQESLLYSFASDADTPSDAFPSSLVIDGAGNLYGAAGYTGITNEAYGSIFELAPSPTLPWHEANLATFSSALSNPTGSLIFDKSGNLYGTVLNGGPSGHGAVIEFTPRGNGKWKLTTIYNFAGYPNDGSHPGAALVMDAAGNFYGTTEAGGSSSSNCFTENNQPSGCGAVFELQPLSGGGWKETVLYSFAGGTADGAIPSAPLIFDSAGNLYGTTLAGGIKNKDCRSNRQIFGCGTVFELSPSAGGSWSEAMLHQFSNSDGDGALPQSGVIFDSLGNLYGTTTTGGTSAGGTVYELSPNSGGGWTESIVHSFAGYFEGDGADAYGGLILDSAGNLYGTTVSGGATNSGTVFEITP
jgi:uncharacterized repeat protein (TIGR03803 family)